MNREKEGDADYTQPNKLGNIFTQDLLDSYENYKKLSEENK